MAAAARAAPAATTSRTVDKVWEVLKAFASFGFCKAHAAAFALPTYQSAWLKAHHPAAFLAGVLTHDPGMYPSGSSSTTPASSASRCCRSTSTAPTATYRVERVEPSTSRRRRPRRRRATWPRDLDCRTGAATASGWRSRTSRASPTAEVARIVAGRPYGSLADFWHRAAVSRPVVERLVLAGAFDALYALAVGGHRPVRPARAG